MDYGNGYENGYDNSYYYGSQSHHPQHSPYQQPPPISIQPPEPSQPRYPPSPYSADREDGREANFDFGFGGYVNHPGSQYPPQHQHQQHPLPQLPRAMDYDSRQNSEIYADNVPLGVYNQESRFNSQTTLLPSPSRSQSPYAAYPNAPYHPQQPYHSTNQSSQQLSRGMEFDSRTNSEIYAGSTPTGMYYNDSRFNSQTNLLPPASPSPYPGYHSPGFQSPVSSNTRLGSEVELLRTQASSPSINVSQPFPLVNALR